MNKPSALLASFITAVSLTACGQQDNDQQAEAEPERPTSDTAQASSFKLDGDASRGQPIYAANCTSCHGVAGRGDGPAGRALRPPATDFTTAAQMTPERAYLVVRDGGMAAGLAPTMPAFSRSLDDQQIHDVVTYVMQLREGSE